MGRFGRDVAMGSTATAQDTSPAVGCESLRETASAVRTAADELAKMPSDEITPIRFAEISVSVVNSQRKVASLLDAAADLIEKLTNGIGTDSTRGPGDPGRGTGNPQG